jgi:hypothetical protein
MAPQLRQLGVGEILDVGIKIYLRNWLTLWKIVVFVVLPAQILASLITVSTLPDHAQFIGGTVVVFNQHDLNVVRAGIFAGIAITGLATLLAQGACFRAIADAYLGEKARAGSSLRFAGRRLLALIVLTIAFVIAVIAGLILCIIPGIWLAVSFYVAVPVLLVEGVGPFSALGRSRGLVKGRWWGTLGVAVVGALLVGIITYVIDLVVLGIVFAHPHPNTVTGFALSTLAATLSSMLTMPAAAAFATVLYIDLRVRKEGFDLLLLARGIGSASTVTAATPSIAAPASPAPSGGDLFGSPPPGGQPDDK